MEPKDTAALLRDRFFSTAIPLNRHATLACLAAGDALLQFVGCFGVETRLFNRDEFEFGPVARRQMREVLAQIIAGVNSLPANEHAEPKRAKAVAKMQRYSEALA